jgi:nitrogen fixation NifU-like protein
MDTLRELYQQVILDHNKTSQNYGSMEKPDAIAQGNNLLCGDSIDVFLRINNRIVKAFQLEGAGCAICTSSASMMTEALTRKSEDEAEALFKSFHHALTDVVELDDVPLGKLKVFMDVKDYPVRVKCETLAWHTFEAALKRLQGDISTE